MFKRIYNKISHVLNRPKYIFLIKNLGHKSIIIKPLQIGGVNL